MKNSCHLEKKCLKCLVKCERGGNGKKKGKDGQREADYVGIETV